MSLQDEMSLMSLDELKIKKEQFDNHFKSRIYYPNIKDENDLKNEVFYSMLLKEIYKKEAL